MEAAAAAGSAVSASFADLMRAALSDADETTPHQPPAHPVVGKSADVTGAADLRQQVAAKIQLFHAHLTRALEEAGIDTSTGVHLQVGPLGDVRVAGDHPQQAEIESLFMHQPELADAFRSIAQHASLLRVLDDQTAAGTLPSVGSPTSSSAGTNGSEESGTFDLFIDSTRIAATFV